jgi:heptaprenyl diphosphate synthase
MENNININKNYIFFLALMTSLSCCLYLVEIFLPKPLPFMKLGLSNIFVLLLICSHYYKASLFVSFFKSVIGAFFSGLLFSPTFLLSLLGSVFACVFMIISHFGLKRLSIFGISIIGAFVHLLTQLFFVRLLIIKNNSIFNIYPVIAILSIITGFLTGLIAMYFKQFIDLRGFYDKIND